VEVTEAKRQIAELEYNEKIRMESLSIKTLQKKEFEIEELKIKNANLLTVKVKLEEANDQMRNELGIMNEKIKPLIQANDWMRTHFGPNPKEFLNRVQNLRESLKLYETKVRKLTEENQQLKENVMNSKVPFTECSNLVNNWINPKSSAMILNEVDIFFIESRWQ